MSTCQAVERDERTAAVEAASHGWAYMLITYALLIDVAVRGFFRNEAAWDRLAIAIGGGLFCAAYQARERIFARGWLWKASVVAVLSAVLAAILAVVATR